MRLVAFFLFSILIFSCHCKRNCKSKNEVNFTPNFAPGPQAIVYKTKKKFNDYIPVTFNEEKTELISYPHPSDVYFNGKLSTPISLNNKYLLDNRGISKYVVILKYKYKDNSKLMKATSIDEKKKSIL